MSSPPNLDKDVHFDDMLRTGIVSVETIDCHQTQASVVDLMPRLSSTCIAVRVSMKLRAFRSLSAAYGTITQRVFLCLSKTENWRLLQVLA